MDAVLTALGQKIPELGVTGVLVFLLVLLIRRESSTEDRHAAELRRINSDHDAELDELRLDVERERIARRSAEDERDRLRKGPG